MYILYLDESGDDTHAYRVMGGVAVYEQSEYHLASNIERVQSDFLPAGSPGGVWFHATDINAHKEEPWKSMRSTERGEVMTGIFDAIASSYTPQVTCFGVALHKPTFPTPDPDTRIFEEICNRFDLFLRHRYSQGDKQKGLVVLSQPRFEEKFPKLLEQYRNIGTRFGRVVNLTAVPLFTSSKASRMLQVADFITWAVFRRYERGDTLSLDRILSKFHREGETLHGLVHFTGDKNCMCPYCMTRGS